MNNQRRRIILSIVCLLGLLLLQSSMTAFAKQAPEPTGLEINHELPDTIISTPTGRYNSVTGAAIALYRVNYAVDADTPEAMARQYLSENAGVLGLISADLSDLTHHATRTSLAGTTVRFTQSVQGVPVHKARIAVHLNHDNVVTYVASNYQPTAVFAAGGVQFSAENARTVAHDHLSISGNIVHEHTELVVYQLNGVSHLAFRVVTVADSPIGQWEAMVSAQDGTLLKVSDESVYDNHGETSRRVEGTASVFDPDPLAVGLATYGDPGYVDNLDMDSAELTAARSVVTLLDITQTGALFTLNGPYASEFDVEPPNDGVFVSLTGTSDFTRFDIGFEGPHMYYHTDASMRYINETLGITLMPYQYDGGVRFDPHGLAGMDNSHYIPAVGVMAFGQGGVDDGEDSDVIHHELGHGLHDWLTAGGLSQEDGLSEGSGDYWAQSYNRSLDNWGPTDEPYQWVFRWDGHNEFFSGRITDYGADYPSGLVGQIHTDGQIWATCLMKIYDQIGRTKTDIIFLEGLAMTDNNTNQDAAANAALQVAIDMDYPLSDQAIISDTFRECGYNTPVIEQAPTAVSLTDTQSPRTTAPVVLIGVVLTMLIGMTIVLHRKHT